MQRSISILRRCGAMLLVVLLAVSLSIIPTQKAHAAVQATYYVSPTGSNSNSGTDITHPFATIDHVRQVIETINSSMTGDILVYLLSGTCHESLTIGANDSGTNGYNILYEAYPGAQPVLSGDTQITGWVLHDSSKNIWQASIPVGFDTRQLYISGVRAHRAQSGALPSGTTQTSTGYTIPNTTLQNLTSPADLETFGTLATTGAQMQELVRDGSGTTTFYHNSTQSGSTSSATPNTPTTATYIGGVNSNASNLFSGDIAEVLIYNRALSTSERQQVEQYLLTPYGL